jgi:microcystin-dependent protein
MASKLKLNEVLLQSPNGLVEKAISMGDDGIVKIDGSNLLPSGAIQMFAMVTPPTGWLKANGQAISRTTYASLFSAIGTIYGVGDGSTTFNVPDLRGEFIRGFDDGRGVDTGRVFGSNQIDQFKSHYHSVDGGWQAGEAYVTTNKALAYVNLTNTSSTGGTETRPRNIAMLFCIKA